MVGFDFRIDFYTQIYCSTPFYINVFKRKLFYLQLNFSMNQFSRISS